MWEAEWSQGLVKAYTSLIPSNHLFLASLLSSQSLPKALICQEKKGVLTRAQVSRKERVMSPPWPLPVAQPVP